MPGRDPDLLTLDAAAREFGLSRQTLYRAAAAGEITMLRQKRGRPRVFVRRTELVKLLEPSPERQRRKGGKK